MSPTWFIIKSLIMTFLIVSVLQIRVGSDAKPLEILFTDWMKNLSASRRIQDVANGGQALTTDFIREFTTPDGHTIYIKEEIKDKNRDSASDKNLSLDTGIIQRLISGIKLDISDLNDKDKLSVKEQAKKELEKEIRNDYEKKLIKQGIDPNTFESIQ